MRISDDSQTDSVPLSATEPAAEMDLFDYILVVVQRRWMIIGWAVLGALGGVLFAASQATFFKAVATIIVLEQKDYLTLENNRRQNIVNRYEHAMLQSFYLNVLEGNSCNQKVLEQTYQYELEGRPYQTDLLEYFDVESAQLGIEYLRGAASFTTPENQLGVISIAVKTLSPQLSAAVANEYIAQLLDISKQRRQREIGEQLDFIEQRLKEFQANLTKAENKVLDFQRRNRNITAELMNTPQGIQLARLMREVENQAGLLSTVQNQYEVAQVEAQKNLADVQVLSYAQPPDLGVKLSPKRGGAVGLVLGGAVAFLLVFVLEFVERSRHLGRLDPIRAELNRDLKRMKRLLGRGRV